MPSCNSGAPSKAGIGSPTQMQSMAVGCPKESRITAVRSQHVARFAVALHATAKRLAGVCGQGSFGGGLGRVKGRGLAGGNERGAVRAAEQFPANLGWESVRG